MNGKKKCFACWRSRLCAGQPASPSSPSFIPPLIDFIQHKTIPFINSISLNAAARFLFNEDKPKASNTAKEESFLSLVAVGAR